METEVERAERLNQALEAIAAGETPEQAGGTLAEPLRGALQAGLTLSRAGRAGGLDVRPTFVLRLEEQLRTDLRLLPADHSSPSAHTSQPAPTDRSLPADQLAPRHPFTPAERVAASEPTLGSLGGVEHAGAERTASGVDADPVDSHQRPRPLGRLAKSLFGLVLLGTLLTGLIAVTLSSRPGSLFYAARLVLERTLLLTTSRPAERTERVLDLAWGQLVDLQLGLASSADDPPWLGSLLDELAGRYALARQLANKSGDLRAERQVETESELAARELARLADRAPSASAALLDRARRSLASLQPAPSKPEPGRPSRPPVDVAEAPASTALPAAVPTRMPQNAPVATATPFVRDLLPSPRQLQPTDAVPTAAGPKPSEPPPTACSDPDCGRRSDRPTAAPTDAPTPEEPTPWPPDATPTRDCWTPDCEDPTEVPPNDPSPVP